MPGRLRLNRRTFLLSLGGLIAATAATGSYARWIEPRRLKISRHTVPTRTPSARQPIKLLHLTDLHVTDTASLEHLARAIDTGLALAPDLACITGDFVTRREHIVTGYVDILRRLSSRVPTFATLGNHDGGIWSANYGGDSSSQAVRQLLSDSRIPCIHNSTTAISIHGRPLVLTGLGDLWNGECRPAQAFPAASSPSDAIRVVLSHNPDSKSRLLARDWDLLLSGHTHGGQIGLPFLARRFAPVADKRFLHGLHRWENRWLHVGQGVGCLHGIRFACPPEIALLTLA